jgi:signal peptide peptidase-like protein 2B
MQLSSLDPLLARLLTIYCEPSTWLLLGFVVIILILGSYRSANFSFDKSIGVLAQLEEELESSMNLVTVVLIPLIGSVMLMVLFFFLGKMFIFLVILFAFGSFTSCVTFLMPTVAVARHHVLPRVNDTQTITIRRAEYTAPIVDIVVAGIVAASVVAAWLITSHWVFVDMLAFCLACETVKTLRVPDLRIASLLLSIFFVYDVFWVFISPFIFSQSVMVAVAVGVTSQSIPLPMLFMIPKASVVHLV